MLYCVVLFEMNSISKTESKIKDFSTLVFKSIDKSNFNDRFHILVKDSFFLILDQCVP